MKDTLTVVLGGGRGTRLRPLTAKRAKPAVPLAGKYRLIDVPISNGINSGLRQIYVLTQFNSASLNAHVSKTYRFDAFSEGFVEVLAAEQTASSGAWYQGTADAVRQQLHHFDRQWVRDVLILSGDHLYRMDYRKLIERHREAGADITVSCIPVTRARCEGFGVLKADEQGLLQDFREKPPADADLSDLETPDSLRARWHMGERRFLASMGVYVFRREVLSELLSRGHMDFGQHVIPEAIGELDVAAHVFGGYWEDIGTIQAFYRANLALCDDDPPFQLYDPKAPIYTRARFLPPSRFHDSQVTRALVADGCELDEVEVRRSIIGLRQRLGRRARVEESILMGADYFETEERRARAQVPMGVGEGVSIRRAIIDKNARIGAGAVVHGHPDRPDEEHDDWSVRDGIVCIMKNAVIPPGAEL